MQDLPRAGQHADQRDAGEEGESFALGPHTVIVVAPVARAKLVALL